MAAVTQERAYLDSAALADALRAIPALGLVRLRNRAAFRALGTGLDGDDLLHEAILRAMNGEEGRRCPADVAVPVFLDNAMRSIASGEREKRARDTPIETNDFGETKGIILSDPSPSPEDEAIGRIDLGRILPRIEAAFANDLQALAVLLGIVEDASPEEIREIEPMTENEYLAARKRLRRFVLREFGREKRR